MKSKIDGHSKIYALLGHPVEHTASCSMHNTAFEALGINACYIALDVEARYLKEALASIKALNIAGVNVTIPHKQTCMKYLDKIDTQAKKIGAVNTIINRKGKLIGYNTDADGFIDSLKFDADFSVRNKVIFIMGAGGASRAVAFSLAEEKPKAIYIQDIKDNLASKLVLSLKKYYPKIDIIALRFKDKRKTACLLSEIDMFINATGVGLKKGDPAVIDVKLLDRRTLVCDLIYNPKESALLKAAKKKGLKIINGEGLLLHQGIRAFKIWTNKAPEVKLYKKALANFLKDRS
jgi:shikimate dehydrogenase